MDSDGLTMSEVVTAHTGQEIGATFYHGTILLMGSGLPQMSQLLMHA